MSKPLLISASSQHCRAVEDTCDLSDQKDEEILHCMKNKEKENIRRKPALSHAIISFFLFSFFHLFVIKAFLPQQIRIVFTKIRHFLYSWEKIISNLFLRALNLDPVNSFI